MSVASGYTFESHPTVYRTVVASTDLKTVSGAPKRCAARLIFTNVDAAQQSVVFTGPDGVNVTLVIPIQSTVDIDGSFSTTGAFGANVTCVAGWLDNGSIQPNA